MSEKIKDVEKMIVKVMKKKDLTRDQAIDYMLVVATGRLAALWRYDESVPEGKKTKGVLGLVGRKQRAPKTPKIVVPPLRVSRSASDVAEARVKLPKRPKRAKAPKPKAAPKPKPAKPAKGEKGEQIEIETSATE